MVYLNGVEVARLNMPPAPTAIHSATLSSTKVVAASYANASMVTVPLASVPAGVNRVAVEVGGSVIYMWRTHKFVCVHAFERAALSFVCLWWFGIRVVLEHACIPCQMFTGAPTPMSIKKHVCLYCAHTTMRRFQYGTCFALCLSSVASLPPFHHVPNMFRSTKRVLSAGTAPST
jgi:hypothetical protein